MGRDFLCSKWSITVTSATFIYFYIEEHLCILNYILLKYICFYITIFLLFLFGCAKLLDNNTMVSCWGHAIPTQNIKTFVEGDVQHPHDNNNNNNNNNNIEYLISSILYLQYTHLLCYI